MRHRTGTALTLVFAVAYLVALVIAVEDEELSYLPETNDETDVAVGLMPKRLFTYRYSQFNSPDGKMRRQCPYALTRSGPAFAARGAVELDQQTDSWAETTTETVPVTTYSNPPTPELYVQTRTPPTNLFAVLSSKFQGAHGQNRYKLRLRPQRSEPTASLMNMDPRFYQRTSRSIMTLRTLRRCMPPY